MREKWGTLVEFSAYADREMWARRGHFARVVCYVFGVIVILGLLYFARVPRPSPLDSRAQIALSQFASWMAAASAVVFFGGVFRTEPQIRILTIVYGLAMSFLWVIIAAAHLPVS